MNTSLTERQKSWLTLAALWLLLLILATLRPLAVPDEGRYGEIGRWMLQSGDWLTPRLNGLPFFHKPPYLYWLEAASLATFGVHALALRLVPALHVGLMLVALYLAARAISTEPIARRAALMLGSSLSFLVGGQYVNHDMLVASWIGVAIWCFAFAFLAGERPDARLARLGFAACALGMLSKGLIGIVLPGLVLFIWLLWTRQFKKVLHLPWLSGLALVALIAAPWFLVEQQKFPQFLKYIFVDQQISRATGQHFNNPQPWWFYPPVIVLLLFPWAFFALRQSRNRAQPGQAADSQALASPWWKLCWAWVLGILVFFSGMNSKLVGYILPVMPPLALLAALGWQQAMARFSRATAGRLFVGVCVLNLGLALAIVLSVAHVTRDRRAEDVAKLLACEARASDTVYVAGRDYPYELPFYAQTAKPLVVVQDWVRQRKQAGDDWRRELFEGADFDAHAAQWLQQPEVLQQAALSPGNWLLIRHVGLKEPVAQGWTLFSHGSGFDLYKSADSAPKSPVAAEDKGLPGCKDQGHK